MMHPDDIGYARAGAAGAHAGRMTTMNERFEIAVWSGLNTPTETRDAIVGYLRNSDIPSNKIAVGISDRMLTPFGRLAGAEIRRYPTTGGAEHHRDWARSEIIDAICEVALNRQRREARS